MMGRPKHAEEYGLTKTQAKIFTLLSDGEIHSKADIIEKALGGQFACDHLVPVHINRMRGILAGSDARIVSLGTKNAFQGYRLIIKEPAA